MLFNRHRMAETEISKAIWDETIRLIKKGCLKSAARIIATMNINRRWKIKNADKSGG